MQDIRVAGGWIGFDRFMQAALYAPGLGYYANESPKFGAMPGSGSDFVTAPELSPVFGRVLAAQVREALDATGTHDVWEFGAGSGALAAQLLEALGERVRRYTIVDLSGSLRARQQAWPGQASCRRRWKAWWWATRCWTPCPCSCCTAARACGMSAAWCGMAMASPGKTGPPHCARPWRSAARTTT
jgi:SAM-dependent MidA family methyltransferase